MNPTTQRDDFRYYAVITPKVFREIRLPADEHDWTAADRRKYARLADLAEIHGARVESTSYRRG